MLRPKDKKKRVEVTQNEAEEGFSKALTQENINKELESHREIPLAATIHKISKIAAIDFVTQRKEFINKDKILPFSYSFHEGRLINDQGRTIDYMEAESERCGYTKDSHIFRGLKEAEAHFRSGKRCCVLASPRSERGEREKRGESLDEKAEDTGGVDFHLGSFIYFYELDPSGKRVQGYAIAFNGTNEELGEVLTQINSLGECPVLEPGKDILREALLAEEALSLGSIGAIIEEVLPSQGEYLERLSKEIQNVSTAIQEQNREIDRVTAYFESILKTFSPDLERGVEFLLSHGAHIVESLLLEPEVREQSETFQRGTIPFQALPIVTEEILNAGFVQNDSVFVPTAELSVSAYRPWTALPDTSFQPSFSPDFEYPPIRTDSKIHSSTPALGATSSPRTKDEVFDLDGGGGSVAAAIRGSLREFSRNEKNTHQHESNSVKEGKREFQYLEKNLGRTVLKLAKMEVKLPAQESSHSHVPQSIFAGKVQEVSVREDGSQALQTVTPSSQKIEVRTSPERSRQSMRSKRRERRTILSHPFSQEQSNLVANSLRGGPEKLQPHTLPSSPPAPSQNPSPSRGSSPAESPSGEEVENFRRALDEKRGARQLQENVSLFNEVRRITGAQELIANLGKEAPQVEIERARESKKSIQKILAQEATSFTASSSREYQRKETNSIHRVQEKHSMPPREYREKERSHFEPIHSTPISSRALPSQSLSEIRNLTHELSTPEIRESSSLTISPSPVHEALLSSSTESTLLNQREFVWKAAKSRARKSPSPNKLQGIEALLKELFVTSAREDLLLWFQMVQKRKLSFLSLEELLHYLLGELQVGEDQIHLLTNLLRKEALGTLGTLEREVLLKALSAELERLRAEQGQRAPQQQR